MTTKVWRSETLGGPAVTWCQLPGEPARCVGWADISDAVAITRARRAAARNHRLDAACEELRDRVGNRAALEIGHTWADDGSSVTVVHALRRRRIIDTITIKA